jgi:hypothetical protein
MLLIYYISNIFFIQFLRLFITLWLHEIALSHFINYNLLHVYFKVSECFKYFFACINCHLVHCIELFLNVNGVSVGNKYINPRFPIMGEKAA